jgi:hypothetical protein
VASGGQPRNDLSIPRTLKICGVRELSTTAPYLGIHAPMVILTLS